MLSQIGGIKAVQMQNVSHIIELAFEGSMLVAGLFYLASWMGGRKLTNSQVLFLFAIGFGGLLLMDVLSSIVPYYVFLIVCWTPLLLRQLTLNSKPASQVKLMFARKPSKLPEKSEL
jgi:hypothetical protein